MTPDTRGLSAEQVEALELLAERCLIDGKDYEADALACLLGAAALRQTTWQPITTAEKTLVLVALIRDGRVWRVSEAAHHGVVGWYDQGGKSCSWATHWMPLPAPPVAEGETTR